MEVWLSRFYQDPSVAFLADTCADRGKDRRLSRNLTAERI